MQTRSALALTFFLACGPQPGGDLDTEVSTSDGVDGSTDASDDSSTGDADDADSTGDDTSDDLGEVAHPGTCEDGQVCAIEPTTGVSSCPAGLLCVVVDAAFMRCLQPCGGTERSCGGAPERCAVKAGSTLLCTPSACE